MKFSIKFTFFNRFCQFFIFVYFVIFFQQLLLYKNLKILNKHPNFLIKYYAKYLKAVIKKLKFSQNFKNYFLYHSKFFKNT